jgi:hypothetical protein
MTPPQIPTFAVAFANLMKSVEGYPFDSATTEAKNEAALRLDVATVAFLLQFNGGEPITRENEAFIAPLSALLKGEGYSLTPAEMIALQAVEDSGNVDATGRQQKGFFLELLCFCVEDPGGD